MSGVNSISSNLIKKAIPLYALSSAATGKPSPTMNYTSPKGITPIHGGPHLLAASRIIGNGPNELPAKPPPEIPTATPLDAPNVPPEVTRRTSGPDFDPIPLEQPADPPPTSPGRSPEFPGPPNPSPPKPEGPQSPIPSPPEQPEVFPPHGPDVIPPRPPEPGEVVPPRPPIMDPPSGPDFIPPEPPAPEPGFPYPMTPDIPPIVM